MVKTISPQQADTWLREGQAILIDVREPQEFQAQHIIQAQSLPLSVMREQGLEFSFPPNMKVIMQCQKGKRGETGCILLNARNIGNEIYNIEGGLEAWIENGLPIVGAQGLKISIFRQVQMIVGSLIVLMIILGQIGWPTGYIIAAIMGAALAFAGVSGWCGLAMLLQKMPWNK